MLKITKPAANRVDIELAGLLDSETMRKEIGIIAHSCGAARPRLLERRHCRVVQENGLSIPLDELYPGPS